MCMASSIQESAWINASQAESNKASSKQSSASAILSLSSWPCTSKGSFFLGWIIEGPRPNRQKQKALQSHQTPKTLVVYHGLSWLMVYHCCPTSSSRFGHSNHLSSKRQAPSFSLIPPADLLAVRLQIKRSPNALRNSGTASASSVARKIQGDPEDQCRISGKLAWFSQKTAGCPKSCYGKWMTIAHLLGGLTYTICIYHVKMVILYLCIYIYMSSYVCLPDRYPMSHVRLARRSDERPTAGDLVKTLRPSYLKSSTTCNNHYQAINSPLLTINNLTYWTIMWISWDDPVLIYQLGNSVRSSDLPIFVMFIPLSSLHPRISSSPSHPPCSYPLATFRTAWI